MMFNDSWIYLQHTQRLYSDTVENNIFLCVDSNAETEKVFVIFGIAVCDEHGIQLFQKDTTNTYTNSVGYGFRVANFPEDHTHVTCILQIRSWNAIPINRAQG